MTEGPQYIAVKWVSIVLTSLMLILIASVILAGGLVGFPSLVESLFYALATITPLAILLFLALTKKDNGRMSQTP